MTRSKNITKFPRCIDNTGRLFHVLPDGEEVTLPYVVELNPSPSLKPWLNANCDGYYTSRCDWSYYTARTPDNEYSFELERDSVLAKMFHGGEA